MGAILKEGPIWGDESAKNPVIPPPRPPPPDLPIQLIRKGSTSVPLFGTRHSCVHGLFCTFATDLQHGTIGILRLAGYRLLKHGAIRWLMLFPLLRSGLPVCCLSLFCCCLFGILCPCLMSCCLSSLPLCISLSRKYSGPLFLLCFPAFAEILFAFCNWDTGRHTGAHPPLCVSYLFCIWDTSSFCSPCTKKAPPFSLAFGAWFFIISSCGQLTVWLFLLLVVFWSFPDLRHFLRYHLCIYIRLMRSLFHGHRFYFWYRITFFDHFWVLT